MAAETATKANVFVRAFRKIGSFFRDIKSEIKKIIWPTPQKLAKDTAIVIVAVAIIGVLMWILGFLIQAGLSLIIK